MNDRAVVIIGALFLQHCYRPRALACFAVRLVLGSTTAKRGQAAA